VDYDPDAGVATVEQRSPFRPGMEVEFVGPGGRSFKQRIGEITDAEGVRLDVARHPLQLIRLKTEQPVEPFDLMRKKVH